MRRLWAWDRSGGRVALARHPWVGWVLLFLILGTWTSVASCTKEGSSHGWKDHAKRKERGGGGG